MVTACSGMWLFAQEPPDALGMYRNGEYEAAIRVCLNELAETPRNMNSYAVLCWSLLQLERYQEALDYGLQGLEISRYDPRMVEAVGEANFFLGNNLDALRYFEEYAVLAPTGDRIESVYYYMGEIFIRLGEYNHADIALTTAVYHSPNTARWWTRLGYAREMAEDYRYSLVAYQKALQLNPSSQDAVRGTERVREKLDSR